jgi:hypothetical protein
MNSRLPMRTYPTNYRRHEQGMAVIAVMVIISILLIYIGGNLRALHLLHKDLKQIEQKQLRRLQVAYPATNSVAIANTNWSTNYATARAVK